MFKDEITAEDGQLAAARIHNLITQQSDPVMFQIAIALVGILNEQRRLARDMSARLELIEQRLGLR